MPHEERGRQLLPTGGLRQLIFIYPSLLAVITIVAMGCFYNLNEKMYVRIVEEIELRKRTA